MDTKENKKEFKSTPVIETQVQKSKDGKWIMHRTIITDFKPVTYFEKVLGDSSPIPSSSEVV